jgi:two-component system nitrogen regulation response regulator GlnG
MTVDGAPVNGVCEVASERLDVGVVLTLKSQCVLLLHRLGAPITPGDEFGMVGHSEAMHSLRSEVSRVADLDVPVLLRGESGSGKELVARAIHARSGRASSPFVPVNMAAINTTTAASELFGHVRGAFTGANREHGGFFGRANGGTLFLDEVGELSPEVQVMLLRALESGEIQPVGGASARRVDVRFIAATDSDLEQATLDGAFRVPLFHRLAGYQVVTPPLRDRLDDIARLFVHFLRAELEQVRESHRLEAAVEGQTPWLPASLMCRLVRYTWPGNVRQLRNVARQLVIASRGRDQIQVDETVERLLRDLALPAHDTAPVSPVALKRRPREIGEDELIETLRAQAWRLGPTAAALGMSRTTLYGLIERSSRIRKARDLSAGEIQEALGQFGGDSADAAAHLEVSHRGLKLRMKELGI